MRELIHEYFDQLNDAIARAPQSDEAVEEVLGLISDYVLIANSQGVRGAYNKGPYRRLMQKSLQNAKAAKHRERLELLDISPIDSFHCLAHVDATTSDENGKILVHERRHYFMQIINGKAKTFGWINGDPSDDAASGVNAAFA